MKSENQIIPIYYAGNSVIFAGIFMSAYSAAMTTKHPISINILSMDVTEKDPNFTSVTKEQCEILEKHIKQFHPDNSVRLIDMKDHYEKHIKNSKNDDTIYTPYSMLRLFMDRVEDIEDKCIYLDIDTMVIKDIFELYNVDMTQYEYGAVLDYMGKTWINKDYCNSGVLLLNMKLVKERNLFPKCFDHIKTHKTMLPDQTALYRCVQDKLILPGKFNEQRDIKEDTVVKHFCKGVQWWHPIFTVYNIKQWQIEEVHKKLKIYNFDEIYKVMDQERQKNPDLFK
jgi:lipopolysaccharide biosynthesis glycosyltransferase